MNRIRNFSGWGWGLAVLLLAGCALPGSAAPTPSLDPNSIVTAAVATSYARLTQVALLVVPSASATSTNTVVASVTPIVLPTSIPTMPPMPGVMSANANVRGVPAKSKAHDLGGLLLGQPVSVIGRNDAATWLYILYADSPSGTGWVTVKAITLEGDMGLLPILIYPKGEDSDPIMLPPFIYGVTGTPLPPGPPPADWQKYGTLIQPANVRVGPSVGFLALGYLQPGVKVTFRGRIEENAWVQIDYPSGPDGHGWILSDLVQANDGFGGLPYYNVLGTPVTPTPEQPEATPEAVLTPDASVTPDLPSPTPALAGVQAEVTNQINVRSGPAQSYPALGMLNPKEKVVVIGLTFNRYWFLIEYAGSPTGTGWVASQYLRVLNDMNNLPYFNDLGTPLPK